MKTLGKIAIYQGTEYEFRKKTDGSYALYSDDIKSLEAGFRRISEKEEKFMKIITLDEVEGVFEKETEVIYGGDTFIGSVIQGSKIMLYTRNVLLGQKYNMTMRDKDEFYKYVELKDVDCIVQKWTPYKENI